MRLLCFTMILLVLPVLAFTPAETNQVVKSLLNRIMADAYDDNWTDEPKIILPQQRIDTWETFIGGTIAPGWSFNDKKGAFDWYLSTLGTKECLDLPQGQKDYVLGAISQCFELRYTNEQSGCGQQARNYFISVTNQLLSSGQPLQQLDIGEGDNE